MSIDTENTVDSQKLEKDRDCLIECMNLAVDLTMMQYKRDGNGNVIDDDDSVASVDTGIGPLPNKYKEILRKIISDISRNKRNHFLSLSQDENSRESSKVSYSTDKSDTSKSRVRSTLARYIKRNFKISNDIPDHIFQGYTNTFDSLILVNAVGYNVELVTGRDLVETYQRCENSRASSCMTGSNSVLTKLYGWNDSKCAIAIHKSEDGNIDSRALVWTADDGTRILDRVYPDDAGSHILKMKMWAKKQGIEVRGYNGFPVTDIIPVSSKGIHQVVLKSPCRFPYCDTFTYGTIIDEGGKDLLEDVKPKSEMMNVVNQIITDADYYSKPISIILSNSVKGKPLFLNSPRGSFSINSSCDDCGDYSIQKNLTHINDKHVCKDCVKRYKKCDCCGNLFTDSAGLETVEYGNGKTKTLCEACLTIVATCKNCGNMSMQYIVTDKDEVFCQDCYRDFVIECSRCYDYVLKGECVEDSSGKILCQACSSR